MLSSFGIPFVQELPIEEYCIVLELGRHNLLQCLLIGSIVVEYWCIGIQDLDHDDYLVLRARV